MALINCPECGKEISDRATSCPNCGCPVDPVGFNEGNQNVTENSGFLYQLQNAFQNSVQNAGNSSLFSYRATRKIGPVKIDENNKMFQINGTILQNGKKTGIIGKSFKGLMAVSTLGISTAAEKALGIGGKKVGTNEWHEFSDLISYDLIEDDSVVTTGGCGQALIGGALFGGLGAVAGGITGKRVQKKRIESLSIKVTLNSFKNSCVLIPLITKPTKTNSKEYKNAFEDAQKMLSILDVITHNK